MRWRGRQVHGGAEGEMTTDADAHGAELAGTLTGGEVVEYGAGVGVVGCDGLVGLEEVAAVGAAWS
jgi:hypothetical protein